MKPSFLAGMSFLFLASILSSCTTNNMDKIAAGITPEEKASSLKSGVKIDNDIKSILMAGGLDSNNPSATKSGGVQLASNGATTSRQNEVATLAATLSPAAQSPSVPTSVNSSEPAIMGKPNTLPTTTLALVEPKPKVTEESYKFSDIDPTLRGMKQTSKTARPSISALKVKKPAPFILGADQTKFTDAGTMPKTERPEPSVVYAEPTVKRF